MMTSGQVSRSPPRPDFSDPREVRAYAKAREQEAVGNRPVPLGLIGGKRVYRITSRQPAPVCPHCGAVLPDAAALYLVSVDPDGTFTCDCSTGRVGGVCWHRTAVMLLMARQSASQNKGQSCRSRMTGQPACQ
jgi:hypothetical protein